jgi:chemotaxis response regulator CheB
MGETLRSADVRVLVVDDDDSVRRVLTITLSVADGVTEVREAIDGSDALEVCRSFTPDVVFLDYWMPAMDGEVAAGTIRRLCPSAHIISFSGVLEGKPRWADQHFTKGEMPDVEEIINHARERLSDATTSP